MILRVYEFLGEFWLKLNIFLKTYLIESVPSFWTSSFARSRNHPIFRHIHFQIFVTPLFHEFFLWQNSWIHVMPLQDYFSALFTHKNSSNSVFLQKRQIYEFFGRKSPFKDYNASARNKAYLHITVIRIKTRLDNVVQTDFISIFRLENKNISSNFRT